MRKDISFPDPIPKAVTNRKRIMTDMKRPAPETITVPDDTDEVSCDGGGGVLGHPKVWYSFDGQDGVECGYCDRLFVKARARRTGT